MFYRPGSGEMNLPHDPLKAIVTPRPIAWVSTVDAKGGVNLAPFSFFNALSDKPPTVVFACNGVKSEADNRKDTLENIRATGEFVVNIVSYDLRDAMNITSKHYDADVDEFERAGLEKGVCEIVRPPRVAASPAALECKLFQIIDLPGEANTAIIGEVVGIHIDDNVIVDGKFDVTRFTPLARLGYRDYTKVDNLFSLNRPEQE